MKKNILIGLTLITSIFFVSCKSKQSSYKQAYEKAKAQETIITDVVEVPTPVTTPVQTPVQTPSQDYSDLRSERLTAIDGSTLQKFNVVVGAFGNLDNAKRRQSEVAAKGYRAVIAQNPETGIYRVIASTHSDRTSANSSRDGLRSSYTDAWILYLK